MERHSDQNGAVLSRRAIDGKIIRVRRRPDRVQSDQRESKRHTEHPYGTNNRTRRNSSSFQDKIQDPWCRAWQNESKNSTPSTTCWRTGTHSSSQNQREPSGSDHKESHQMPHYKRRGSTQSTWSQVAYTLIVPGTCRPCFPTLSIK